MAVVEEVASAPRIQGQTAAGAVVDPNTPAAGTAVLEPSERDHLGAAAMIASHTLQHMYSHAFYVILPVIYTSLGLSPLAAGLMGSIRSLGSGASSTVGGFLIDRLQHRRLMILYLTLITMGLGYVAVGLAPNYVLIVVALAFAAMAGSIWHPAARSLLSQIYPRRRGMMISLDRSAGSVGDTVGPVAAGALLVVMAWQQIFLLALPISLLMCLFLWSFLRRAETFQELGARSRGEARAMSAQFREIRELLSSSGRVLTILLLVKGIIGLGMGGLVLWIPLYLQETVGMDSLGIGFHVALLTGVGVVTSPGFGYLSDRMGRLPVVLLALGGKAAVAALMAAFGSGLMLTILIGAMGVFMTGIQPIVQAWALDIAHGRKLEGTMMGALYGSNLAFHAAGPLVVGLVVTFIGFNNLFWYVAVMQTAAFILVTGSLLLLGRTSQAATGAK